MRFLQDLRLEYLALCLPAGVFWLWYVWRRSLPHPPPGWLIAVACALGACSPELVLRFDAYIQTHEIPWISSLTLGEDVASSIVYFIVMVGCVEETSKMLAVRFSVYYSRSFDDALHGVVYSSAAALGFATVENARYVDAHGAEVLIGRAIMSTFGHVLLSMVWGFAIGAQRMRARQGLRSWLSGWAVLAVAVLLAATLHGLYDFFLFQDHMWLSLLLLFTLWRVFVAQTEYVRHHSPFRRPVSRRMRECDHCHGLVRQEGSFCGSCGHGLEPFAASYCAACGAPLGAETRCPSCAVILR